MTVEVSIDEPKARPVWQAFGSSIDTSTVIPQQLLVVTRERAAKMYPILPFYLGSFACSLLLSVPMQLVNSVIGDDICTLLVGDRHRRRRHYTVRAMTVLQVFVLAGDDLCEVIEGGAFDEFKVGVRRYGIFLRVQRALIVHTRNRLRGHGHHAADYTFDHHHAHTSGGSPPESPTHEDDSDDEEIDSDEAISALADLGEDCARLLAAAKGARRRFAADNADITALAPVFADVKRRVDAALAKHEKHSADAFPTSAHHKEEATVSSLEREQIESRAGFRRAV